MTTVVKVGGSLYDLPDLGSRLRRWLEQQAGPLVLVPGGGDTTDIVRFLDRQHRLGEEKAHWLALRALTMNAHFLASLVPSTRVSDDFREVKKIFSQGEVPILDMFPFAQEDEQETAHLPHDWNATSDALALRLALRLGAERLVLLKSVSIPTGINWHQASREGWVDDCFAKLADHAGAGLTIEMVNFRKKG